MTSGLEDVHLGFLQEALREAQSCEPVPSAFCVGCVLVTHWPRLDSKSILLSKGHSRELAGNTHAESNALAKARSLSYEDLAHMFGDPPPSIAELLTNADVYTTMEPCSIRTSGLAPCADALMLAKVRRCFIGVAEPDDFVKCEGALKLKNAGIEVVWLKGLEQECLDEARRGHKA
ncbi:diaminohydroxyphosphoribosylamino-pyrimidine deaminase [Gautieria morchelliformis]|nr:diaminohydroxyphosphoribosylamino-pyrimidine deaminase [Gautieria morchelliformis]